MKTKDKKELQSKSLEELNKKLLEIKDLLTDLKLDKAQNKLKNTRQLFLKRKEIAQILTVIRIKELAKKEKKP